MRKMMIWTFAFSVFATFGMFAVIASDNQQPVKARAELPKVWIIHGQTTVNAGSVADDPMANMPGTIGEAALPYVVPAGKKLILLSQGVEGTTGPVSALYPWLGDYPPGSNAHDQTNWRKANALFTVQSSGGSREHPVRFVIPAGTKIHTRLTNGTLMATTLAWFLRGVLIDDTDDETVWLK